MLGRAPKGFARVVVPLSQKSPWKDEAPDAVASNVGRASVNSSAGEGSRRSWPARWKRTSRNGDPVSVFKNAGEVYAYIGKMFEIAVAESSFVEATKGTDLVVLLTQTDPDASILIDRTAADVVGQQ